MKIIKFSEFKKKDYKKSKKINLDMNPKYDRESQGTLDFLMSKLINSFLEKPEKIEDKKEFENVVTFFILSMKEETTNKVYRYVNEDNEVFDLHFKDYIISGFEWNERDNFQPNIVTDFDLYKVEK